MNSKGSGLVGPQIPGTPSCPSASPPPPPWPGPALVFHNPDGLAGRGTPGLADSSAIGSSSGAFRKSCWTPKPQASEPGRHGAGCGVPRPHVEYLTPVGSYIWTETPFPPPALCPPVLPGGTRPPSFLGVCSWEPVVDGPWYQIRQSQDSLVTSPRKLHGRDSQKGPGIKEEAPLGPGSGSHLGFSFGLGLESGFSLAPGQELRLPSKARDTELERPGAREGLV